MRTKRVLLPYCFHVGAVWKQRNFASREIVVTAKS